MGNPSLSLLQDGRACIQADYEDTSRHPDLLPDEGCWRGDRDRTVDSRLPHR